MPKRHKRHNSVERSLKDLEIRFEPVADHVESHERELIDHEARLRRLETQTRRSRCRRG